MPWMIVRNQSKFCVYKKGDDGFPVGEARGCYDTRKEAVEQLRALYANAKALKAVSKTEDELRVRGYLVIWGGRDLEGVGSDRKNADGSRGQFFTRETEFESDYTESNSVIVDWEHGGDPDGIGNHKDVILGYVDWKSAQIDEEGLVVERVLNRRHKYMRWLEKLIDMGVVGSSSEATPDAEVGPDGRILRWPLKRDTFTVMPMEPRLMTRAILEVSKALDDIPEESDSGDQKAQSGTDQKPGVKKSVKQPMLKGVLPMNLEALIKALQALLPDIEPDKLTAIASLLKPAMQTSQAGDSLTPEGLKAMLSELGIGQTPSFDKEALKSALEELGIVGDPQRPPYTFKGKKEGDAEGEDAAAKEAAVKALYHVRYGEEDALKQVVLEDAVGKNYRQIILEQNKAFAKALRVDRSRLPLADQELLQKQIFPIEQILAMVKDGWSIGEIKTVMVEAQGDLGGDAVPPNWQSEIIRRLPGNTVVRGSGATVVTLANGNSIDMPVYTGGDARYVGALRGQWGNETAQPTPQHGTTGLAPLMADLYTYKVQMSRTLTEDASNLVALVLSDMITTMALDEDEAFLTGHGSGRPRGILPGSVNADSLTEVLTGDSSAIVATTPKRLKRGIPWQYRRNGVFIGASDTYGDIEQIQATDGKFIYEDLTDKDMLLNRRIFESEAMPPVAAGQYPMIFGDMSGYYIVERLGYSIERFHDSNTGINMVEYHIRRRIGGRVIKPWMFCVLKVANS